jgi:hypothetical protein
MQRWNNKLILEGLSFREAYLDGRIAVALIMQVGGAIRRQPPTKGQHEQGSPWNIRNVVLIINAPNGELCIAHDGYHKPVLVVSIKLIEPNELASIAVYQISYDQSDVRCTSLYFFVMRLTYQRLPVYVYRKGGPLWISSEGPQNFSPNII